MKADARTTAALLAGDAAAWADVLAHVAREAPPPPDDAWLAALFAVEPSLLAWLDAARAAAAADPTHDQHTVTTRFAAWFVAGVARAPGVDDGVRLDARYVALLDLLPPGPDDERPTPDEALAAARALVVDARAAWDDDGVGRLLLLVHRRATEAGAFDVAEKAVIEADARLAQGDDGMWRFARRLRAGSLLRKGNLYGAFALLDDLLDVPGPLFGGGGAHAFAALPDPVDAPVDRARAEAADVAAWAVETDCEWVRALGGMAEHEPDDDERAALWRRFDRALGRMIAASRDPRADVAVVVRQARERRLHQTADRAEAARR